MDAEVFFVKSIGTNYTTRNNSKILLNFEPMIWSVGIVAI